MLSGKVRCPNALHVSFDCVTIALKLCRKVLLVALQSTAKVATKHNQQPDSAAQGQERICTVAHYAAAARGATSR
jgi:hypothetical protein